MGHFVTNSVAVKILGVAFTNHLSVSLHIHSVRHQFLRPTSVRFAATASSRHVWKALQHFIQSCDYFQNLPRRNYLVGLHVSYRQTTPGGFSPPQRTCTCAAVCVLQNYLIWLNLSKQPMTNCSSSPSKTIISSLLFLFPKSDNRYNLHKKHHNRELQR